MIPTKEECRRIAAERNAYLNAWRAVHPFSSILLEIRIWWYTVESIWFPAASRRRVRREVEKAQRS